MAKIINGSTIHLALADYLATNAYLNDTAQDVLVMVAKWIDEAPEIEIPKWIPVTERLPEESGEYLCYCGEYDGICIVYLEILKTKSKWRSNRKRVTHWMPMPEPPKEK